MAVQYSDIFTLFLLTEFSHDGYHLADDFGISVIAVLDSFMSVLRIRVQH
jgi:hypothetical protein